MKQHTNTYSNSVETLHQPENLLIHRDRVVIPTAVENLRPHAPVEAIVVPLSQEVIDYRAQRESPDVIAAAEEITRTVAEANQLTVERLVDTARNYALGEGNPLVDGALDA